MAGIDTYRSRALSLLRLLPIFALSAIFTNPSFSQTGWETVAGGPVDERNPLCVAVTDSLHSVVGGSSGFLARTTDGGKTWIRFYTGLTDNFVGISFSDRYRGTVIGGTQSVILRTGDGGVTWQRQANGPFGPGESFTSVSFSDSINGVIVTLDGKIFHTSNGGGEWLRAGPQLFRGLHRVRLKSLYGIAVGFVGDTYRTSDGGLSWYFHSGMTGVSAFRDVFLLDSLTAVAVGDEGVIRRTTDGGIFWTTVESGTTVRLQSILFFDDTNGIIGTEHGTILRTTDRGMSWSPPEPTPMSSAWDLAFAPPGFGLCVTKFDGRIFRTGFGGTSWEALEYIWDGDFLGVCSPLPGLVFVVGQGGRIVFSSDSGRNWTEQSGGTGATLRAVQFSGPADGWIAGDSGIVLHTTDGGLDWARLPVPVPDNLRAIAAIGAGTAVVVGEENTILRTTDGGISWTPGQSPVFDHWEDISFLDDATGLAAGRNGSMIRTTDGGESWQTFHVAGSLTDIVYLDRDHVYAIGTEAGDTLGGLIRTTDGGATWTFLRMSEWNIVAGSFANPGYGYVSGGGGKLYVTQDAGLSWFNRSPSAAAFHAVAMAGPRAAFAVGASGVIARMRSDGGISGFCFRDLDHDGGHDPNEVGLGGRTIYLGGPFAESTLTASDGTFGFPSLPYGIYTVRPNDALFWEQTAPAPLTPDTLMISPGSELGLCRDIGFSGPVVRHRIPIFVSDSTSFAHRYIWCGIRPGATFGIWGPDSEASVTDSIEGEYEIPPRSFAEFVGLFDARFTDPRYPLNQATDRFGEGSWTDMRSYRSAVQRDTFLLSFLPGYYFGGDYPMTLSWSPSLVAKSFSGPVLLIDSHGTTIDMKSAGVVTITDNTISSLLLVAQSPNFPTSWLTRWRLFSLPGPAGDGSVRSLFSTAASRAYAFVPGEGYSADDTLRPNRGYWLKYISMVDTISFEPTARLRDTVGVSTGWNLVGSLSAPVGVRSLTTEPEGLTTGYFFGYEDGYSVADSLLPGKAYWVRSDRDGIIILDAGAPSNGGPPRSRSEHDEALSRLTQIRFEDAALNAGALYLGEQEEIDATDAQLPPPPPDGVFDIRFGSDRCAELIKAGAAARYQIRISSAKFPLTVTLSPGLSMPVYLSQGDRIIPLPAGVPVTIPEPELRSDDGAGRRRLMTIVIPVQAGLPEEYELLQNYPNPFNPTTLISYGLPVPSRLKIRVYDVVGREVGVLFDGDENAGYGSIVWSAAGAASGVYFCRMEAAGLANPARTFSAVRKLVLVR